MQITVMMKCLYKNSKVWNEGHLNFVNIDLTSSKLNGKYRKNLDCFYLPGIDSDYTLIQN